MNAVVVFVMDNKPRQSRRLRNNSSTQQHADTLFVAVVDEQNGAVVSFWIYMSNYRGSIHLKQFHHSLLCAAK